MVQIEFTQGRSSLKGSGIKYGCDYLIPRSTSDTFHVICNDVLLPQDDVLPPPVLDHPQVL